MGNTTSIAEARANFSQIVNKVRATQQPIVVFKNSKPWVTINPIAEDDDYYTITNPETIAAIKEANEMLKDKEAGYNNVKDLVNALNKD